MRCLSEKEKAALRAKYPLGSRVKLVKMNDEDAPPVGTKGIVMFIDAVGTVHVKWDNGSCLGLIYGVDECKKIKK